MPVCTSKRVVRHICVLVRSVIESDKVLKCASSSIAVFVISGKSEELASGLVNGYRFFYSCRPSFWIDFSCVVRQYHILHFAVVHIRDKRTVSDIISFGIDELSLSEVNIHRINRTAQSWINGSHVGRIEFSFNHEISTIIHIVLIVRIRGIWQSRKVGSSQITNLSNIDFISCVVPEETFSVRNGLVAAVSQEGGSDIRPRSNSYAQHD